MRILVPKVQMLVAASLCVLLSVLACGCDPECNCNVPLCPGEDRLRGTVTGGQGPLADVAVLAVYNGPQENYRATVEAKTDADGSFVLDLAPGKYLVGIRPPSGGDRVYYSSSGPTWSSSAASLVTVFADQETVIDFVLGAIALEVQLPEALASEDIRFYIKPAQSSHVIADLLSGSNQGDHRTVTFDGLVEGSYQAFLSPYLQAQRLYNCVVHLPPVLDPAQHAILSVRPGELVSWEGTLPDPGEMRGTVTGDWLSLDLGEPSVSLWGPDSTLFLRTEANKDGEFRFPVFMQGETRMRVELDDAARWVEGATFSEARAYAITPGMETVADPIPLGGVICHLSGEEAGWPAAELDIYDRTGSFWAGIEHPVPGRFTIPNLRAGVYRLFVDRRADASWRPQWYDRAVNSNEATPIEILNDGTVVNITIVLEKGGSIAGRVFDADDSPASFARISATSSWSQGWSIDGDCAADGTFLIQGLPDADFILAARASNSTDWIYYPGVEDSHLAQTIAVADAGSTSGIEWRLH